MMELGPQWRLVGGALAAWFDASSLTEGTQLAEAAMSVNGIADLRSTGVRIRLDSAEHTDTLSAAAHQLGLTADPSALQQLSVVFESTGPARITPFWQRVTAYSPADDRLIDPLRRDPDFRFRPSSADRPLRNRIHLDVVRPASNVEQADVGEAFGPYGVCHRDADGNEVDLVPGDAIEAASDWQAVFSGVACYHVTSPEQQRELTVTVAQLADEAGFPLLIDLRPGRVILDSGKDLWEEDARFSELAQRVQTAAGELGAVAESGIPRFVQLFLDAADVPAVRGFWTTALGYVPDSRAAVTDIIDPRRLNPVFVFQELDPTETERRRQLNRIQVELTVPTDTADNRVATALAAGGKLLDQSDNRWQIADPEGNELVITHAG